MSATKASFSKPQRSSSATRSRRATLSVGQPGALLGNGSLSPQRALRARVLRERSNSGIKHQQSSDVGVAAKAQEQAKLLSKGPTRTQHMQFAFGSKISKPTSSRAGMAGPGGAIAPTRARTVTATATASTVHGAGETDTENVLGRSRREQAGRHEPQEQEQEQQHQQQQQPRASSRGRGTTRAEQQQRQPQPLVAKTRQSSDVAAIKVQLEEKDAVIVELRRKLEEHEMQVGQQASGGDKTARTPRPSSDISKAGVVDDLNELNEGELAELRGVEEDARADAEEKLARVEAVAAAAFTRAEEMQRRVNKIIQDLKTRRKL